MFELAEVARRETQYGIRVRGEIQPVSIGPAMAESYRRAGVDIHSREKTIYHPDATEWREMPTPASAEGA